MSTSIISLIVPGGPISIPLDFRPHHAAALGRLLGHWAYLEHELVSILQMLLDIDRQPKARVVWQEFVSMSGKIKLLRRLNWVFKDGSLKEELDKLLESADNLNNMRNAYIHALWAEPGGDSPHLERVRNSPPGNHKIPFRESDSITPEDIQNDVIKISELSASLGNWRDRVQADLSKQT